jgi:hypothetical protein
MQVNEGIVIYHQVGCFVLLPTYPRWKLVFEIFTNWSLQATEDQMADTTSGGEVRLTSPAGVQIVVLSAFVLLLFSDL